MLPRASRAALHSAVALALCIGASASAASANGRFPAAQHVFIGPGRAERTLALRTTFGFAISDDGGASFHWECEQALGYLGGAFDPTFVVDAAGRLRIGMFDGIGTLGTDRCGVTRDPTLEGVFVADLDADPTGDVVLAVSSSGDPGVPSRVYRSTAGGAFEPLGAGVAGVLFDTLEMAPSDPQRVYLTGVMLAGHGVVFYRSNDGGATLNEVPFDAASTVRNAYIAGIDPAHPDVLYVRAPLAASTDASPPSSPTVLLRSDDGGTHFLEVGRTTDAMLGFAISDDGQTVWYGGKSSVDGLSRSEDRGLTFARIGSQQIQCLRQHAGVLYACSNFVLDQYALGRSTDRGSHFEPVLRFEDLLAPFPCDIDAQDPNTCAAQWPAVRAQFAPAMDAGRSDGGSGPPTTSCRCRAAGNTRGAGRHGGLPLGVALLTVAIVRRSRARRARKPGRDARGFDAGTVRG